jgi:HlyD family secretion protein
MNVDNKSRRIVIWVVVVVLVGASIWWWKHRSSQSEAVTVDTEVVARGALRESISATGTLSALQTVAVGTQVSGTIDKLYVDFNSKVKAGQLLALLDPTVLDMQLESSRAALTQAKAHADDAVAALKEGENLLTKAYIADRDLRTLRVNAATSKAQVDSAIADLKRAERNRSYAEVRSPIDGVVIERTVDRGQTVASGFQTPTLFTIAEDLQLMQIIASVDESQIGSVQVGQKAEFTVSAFPTKRFMATIRQIRLKSATVQNVVTYSVVLDADNHAGTLLPGMTATVDFILRDLSDVLRVPSSALRVQRIPDEMMDEESLKRIKEREKASSGASAGVSSSAVPSGGQFGANGASGLPGGGNFTPEQIQAFRERMAARQANGGTPPGAPDGQVVGGVWILKEDGKFTRVPVHVLGSDMSATAIEPVFGKIEAGDKVIIRVNNPSANQQGNAQRSLLPGGPPGRFR